MRGERAEAPAAAALWRRGPVAMVLTTPEGEILHASGWAERLLAGGAPVHGTALAKHLAPEDDERFAAFLGEVAGAPPDRSVHFATRTHDGSRHVELTAVSLLDDRDVRAVAIALHDVSPHVERAAALERLATVDVLTGLASRAALRERLDAELLHAGHAGEAGVLLVDLDRFKAVNERYGHGVGDEVLRTLARRLLGLVRTRDLVARVGGDEVVILVSGGADLDVLGERVRAAIAVPVEVPGIEEDVQVTASIGIASSLESGAPDRVLHAADTAMYLAKSRGGNRVERYRSETTSDLLEARAELARLRADNTRLARMVRIDPLTGLLNRRAFDEELRLLEAQLRASDTTSSVLFVDVDRFHGFNKQFGHEAGDRVLALVARCLRSFSRDDDLVFRRGGEEFVMVIPGSDARAAATVAERIRVAVESLAEMDDAVPERVTISVGIAEFRPHADPGLREVVARADAAQRIAKTGGRNRVVVHP